MTFPVALLFMGAALWPATLLIAGVFVVLGLVVKKRLARVLCLAVAFALVVDVLVGLALLSAATYQ